MRSPTELRLRVVVLAAICLVALPQWPVRAQEQDPVLAGSPSAEEIARAIEKVKADPNLAAERTMRTLKWVDTPQARPPGKLPAWLEWIADLFRWAGESARVLVWIAVALLAGFLVMFTLRLIREHGVPRRERFVAPTHVRDLDIRPESLPADIGAAARSLWDRGEHRAALALLYRGLLSRLAHVHGVPIRDSSTEGDCLRLAGSHLDAGRTGFVALLIRAWQRAVYGGEQIEPAVVYELCDRFAPALDLASAPATVPGASAAGHPA